MTSPIPFLLSSLPTFLSLSCLFFLTLVPRPSPASALATYCRVIKTCKYGAGKGPLHSSLPFHYLPPPLPTFSLSLPHIHTGSQDGTVHIWSADTGEKVAVLDGGHPGPTHCTQFNPKLMMMASACSSMVRVHCVM